VEGGSANDYDYVAGDPVNNLDLSGTRIKVKKLGQCAISNGVEACFWVVNRNKNERADHKIRIQFEVTVQAPAATGMIQ
jgi:hypothetical protein